jgi:cytochrome P450
MTEAIAPDVFPPGAFDPRRLPDAFYDDPYPVYRRLRATAPVVRCPDGSWFLTRHADCLQVYRDTHRFSSDKRIQFAPVFGAGSPLFEHHTSSLVFNDPPLHTRVRRAIGDALSPKNVAALAPVVERVVAGLLDTVRSGDEIDLIEAYAAAIPIEVISGLLGIPQHQREPLRAWSLSILGALEFGLDAADLERGNQAVTEFRHFLETLMGARRSAFTEADDDLLARLLRVEGLDDGLTARELLHQCIFLLNAGHETTTNLIGNGVALIADYPNVRDLLRDEPGAIDGVVEEVLRFESPNQLGNRTTTCEVELGGQIIPAGNVLTLCIGAANRDEQAFAEPEAFDPLRSPNPHLAFGGGVHTCAGLNVARLEARIALARWFERFPLLDVIDARRAQRARFRGFSRLQVIPRSC